MLYTECFKFYPKNLILLPTAEYDFIASNTLISLAPGEKEDRVKVPIIDDTIEENREIFTPELSILEVNVNVPSTATVTIIDNDGEQL